MSNKNFGYLGSKFEKSLLKALIEDKKFCVSIIDEIDRNYFENNYFKFIVSVIKDVYKKLGVVPSYHSLEIKILEEYKDTNESILKIHLDTLQSIKDWDPGEIEVVENTTIQFCQQQSLRKALKTIEKMLEKGDPDEYKKSESVIQQALQVGIMNNDVMDVFSDIRSVLDVDNRVPIPTGIDGIDNLLNGGLAVGEFGLVIAPLGVGKTTMLTLFANSAFNTDNNVLQIFFEDQMDNIKRKHYTRWTGIPKSEQIDKKEEVINIVEEKRKESKGKLFLLKLPSGSATVSNIKSEIRKIEATGVKINMLLIDYIECIAPDKTADEDWKGEGAIMRQLDAMTNEFGLAIWAATQGNRESISSEVVNTDQVGGSIKKAQVAHVVISIAKTLKQKELKTGTITICKSRLGDDGIIFENCKFNNEYLDINTDSQNTLLGYEEEKEKKKSEHIAAVYKAKQEKDEKNKSSKKNIQLVES